MQQGPIPGAWIIPREIFAAGGRLFLLPEVVRLEQEIIKLAASQGLWAVLFVALLFYVLRTNEKREERLLSALEKLGTQYENLSESVDEIRNDVKELKGRVGA